MMRRFVPSRIVAPVAARLGSSKNKIMSADDAAYLIKNNDTVVVSGFVSMGTPEELLAAIGRRYEETKSPKDLTVVFQGGPGDWETRGINHLAKEGLVKRSIASHYGQVPMLGQMALDNKIEAYNLPMGVVSRMIRCQAAGQPAHITEIGVGTMVDPKNGGGKINEFTKHDLVDEITIDGKRYLMYRAIPIDVALIRGTYADLDGNITFQREALLGDALNMAMAVRSRRGIVIAQVEDIAENNTLPARQVKIPGTMVDSVVKAKPENHQMGFFHGWDPKVCGDIRSPKKIGKPLPLDIRKIIARRASLELMPNMVVNLGIGMPEGVAMVANEEHCLDYIELTTEPGIHGGAGLSGHNFGPATNYSALISLDHQFDFYNGGGLDIAFLGNAETDGAGNVNVTRVGKKLTGPGGFVDITQATSRVNLLGTFTAGGLEVGVEDGKLKIIKEGKIKKFLNKVKEVTFSGAHALNKKQQVHYITERCVFELTANGLELIEIAPGMDLQKDILAHMEFKPKVREPLRVMSDFIFREPLMKLRQRNFGGSLNMEGRVFADKKNNTVYVSMYNVNVQSMDTISEIEKFLVKYAQDNFPNKDANVVATYDGFDVHPELEQEFIAMIKRLRPLYKKLRSHTSALFRRKQVASALGVVEGDANDAAHFEKDQITCDDMITYMRRIGLSASEESLRNAYVKLYGDQPTIPKEEISTILKSVVLSQ